MSIKSMNENYQFKVLKTNQMTPSQIQDFITLKNRVLSGGFSIVDFEVKYSANPYGESIIILVYDNNECVGCRSFWRNDLYNDYQFITAYQPCDTAVLSAYRGKGIFTKMSELGIQEIGKTIVTYNFPNDNSLQGNYKMGSELVSHLKYGLFQYNKHVSLLEYIDNIYINWLSKSTVKQKLFYMERNGKYFLLKKRKFNVYVVISLLTEKDIEVLQLNQIKFAIFFIYSNDGNIGRGLTTVGRNLRGSNGIPFYKIDTLF